LNEQASAYVSPVADHDAPVVFDHPGRARVFPDETLPPRALLLLEDLVADSDDR
jgi:hypothetical protein